MNTRQIDCVLNATATTSDSFLACLPKDSLVDYIEEVKRRTSNSLSSSFVVNTDAGNRPGEHWVAINIDGDTGRCEWFDSYGFPPAFHGDEFERFVTSLSAGRKILWKNNFMLQSLTSNVCGEYAIAFIFLRSINMQPHAIANLFALHHPAENDRTVSDILHKLAHNQSLTAKCNLRRTRFSDQQSLPGARFIHMR